MGLVQFQSTPSYGPEGIDLIQVNPFVQQPILSRVRPHQGNCLL